MKKKLLDDLGLDVRVFSLWLLLPEQTVYTWFKRGGFFPSKYSEYVTALERYREARKAEEVAAVGARWAGTEDAQRPAQQTAALKKLTLARARCAFKLARLKEKESKSLSQGHLAEQIASYLSPERRNDENTQAWIALLARKSKLEWRKVQVAVHKCEAEFAALEAKINYWNSVG